MINEASRSVSRLSFDVAERGELVIPCPLVSRGRPTHSSDGAFAQLRATGGVPSSGAPSSRPLITAPDDPPWIAVHAGVGPSKMLVSWAVADAGARPAVGRVASAYVIETSASSTNGRDGEWRRESSVASNTASARVHVVEFDGQSWLRLTLSGGFIGSALPFEQLDLHDVSDGTDDCWLVLGAAPLAALVRAPSATGARELCWAELIHERYPGYFPALVDETRAEESPSHTLERLGGLLATHSPASRVAVAYTAASIQSVDADAAALEAMVATMVRAGRLPVLARQPAVRGRAREAVDGFNRCIAAVERRHGLVPGPDLAAWFDAHPDQLDEEGEPTVEGRGAIARLWADAVDVWYVPQ
jgi:hypothetical protein